ncbi:hypothetical protein CRG98_025278 [Punica granatum]|uniref:Uncharacterized protein n=1 Tax=Punica granatum TaxID=22663 RepID=A0A2I0JDM3_PUNGR|nr:hypothetical protein CRG98_025278 [Punica granatum]
MFWDLTHAVFNIQVDRIDAALASVILQVVGGRGYEVALVAETIRLVDRVTRTSDRRLRGSPILLQIWLRSHASPFSLLCPVLFFNHSESIISWLLPLVHVEERKSKTASKSASPQCSALRYSSALTFAFASLAFSYRACIYCIGLQPWGSGPAITASGSDPAFTALGSGPASGSGPVFTASGSGPAFIALGSGPASGSGPAFTASGSGPTSGSGPVLGSSPAFTALGFCLTSGSGPAFTFGFRPCIGLRPHIGLRPCIYCIGLRPCIYFWVSALHRAPAPLLGFGPTFELRPRIYCF